MDLCLVPLLLEEDELSDASSAPDSADSEEEANFVAGIDPLQYVFDEVGEKIYPSCSSEPTNSSGNNGGQTGSSVVVLEGEEERAEISSDAGGSRGSP